MRNPISPRGQICGSNSNVANAVLLLVVLAELFANPLRKAVLIVVAMPSLTTQKDELLDPIRPCGLEGIKRPVDVESPKVHLCFRVPVDAVPGWQMEDEVTPLGGAIETKSGLDVQLVIALSERLE